MRCREIHAAFRDPTVRAIFTTLGGSHANELLPFLDYDLIRANPKIFTGYSDTTFLHFAINKKAGLRTYYCVSTLSDLADAPKPIQFTVDHLLAVLSPSTSVPLGPIPRSQFFAAHENAFFDDAASENPRTLVPSPAWRWVRPGKARGQLFGGVLGCVVRTIGTPYAPDSWVGKMLFVETSMADGNSDLPYPLYRIRESFTDLALAGVLGQVSGVVIGRGYRYDQTMQDEVARVVSEVFETIVWGDKPTPEFPILMNVDFGHTSPLLTLPYGALAELDSSKDEFSILEAGTAV